MARIHRLASAALLVGVGLALPSFASAQKILVNEVYRSGNLEATNEYLELLIVQDITAAELNTYFYGDSTGTPNAKFGSYQFTAMEEIAATFPAGTLLTVGGNTAFAEDVSYDPTNGDWNILLTFASPRITKIGSLGDFAGTDVAWVDTVGTGGETTADGFSVKWGATAGTFGDAATVIVPAPPNNANLFVSGADAFNVDDWSVSGDLTPGEPNGGANTEYIESLRRGDVLLIELESFTATAAHAGSPVSIAWSTSSEIDSVGFNVRRANLQGGNFVPGALVNDSLIPAAGTNGSGASYSLVDPVAVGSGARAYFLIELDANGLRTPYGPFLATVGGSPSAIGEWPVY